MKKALYLFMFLSLLLISFKSFADDQPIVDEDDIIFDLYSEFIDSNSIDSNKKSSELYQNEYTFEFYPYLSMKYVSKDIKNEYLNEGENNAT